MSSSILAGIKKMVTRSGNNAAAASASGAIISQNNQQLVHQDNNNDNSWNATLNKGITTLKSKVSDTILSEFQEREWKCACGHIFRASGEWSPCEPSRCEAPRCPNPKFFLSGPGVNMLNKDGTVPLPQKVAALPASSKTSSKPGSIGSSRFK
jgi:hypothetical protein